MYVKTVALGWFTTLTPYFLEEDILADKYRPTRILEDVVGQKHTQVSSWIIRIEREGLFSKYDIFFCPPGVGKTTVAEIIAARADKKFFKINASNSSIDDKEGCSLNSSLEAQMEYSYIDEIQSFNKKQQQSIWSL